MPIRMLRDWTRSKKMAKLSAGGERLFTRLIMVADDFGNYPANTKLLNGNLFSEYDDVRDADVSKWLSECVAVGVVSLYSVDGTSYIHIIDFGQRLDKARAKYPRETEDNAVREVPGSSGKIRPELETEYEIETETETETETDRADAPPVTVWPTFDDFWNKYDKKTSREKCEKKWSRLARGDQEKIMFHLELYVLATQDKQYRKNPETYLNNKSWNDEIIIPTSNGNGKQITAKGSLDRVNSYRD